MKQRLVLIIILPLLFISCSQKTPTIDGQVSKFSHHFYPAKTDSLYSDNISLSKKYPLIFLFEGFYGEWRKNAIVTKLQRLGYNVVTIGFFDKAGFSNNLSRVNLNGLKKIMDSYKNNLGVDSKSIGVIGRGKGAELALVMGSLYPDIKMVISITGSHVVLQSTQINLAHHSSWVHDDKELDFVPFPLNSWSTIKGAITLLFGGKGYDDIYLNALKNKEAIEKSRIKVEDINGSIYLISNKNDEWLPSVIMGKEIIKRLKKKKFKHNYEYKEYDKPWYLKSHSKEWNDVYRFVTKNLESSYTSALFNAIDKDESNSISINEYINYSELIKKKNHERANVQTIYGCDKNYDKQISFYEVREKYEITHKDEYGITYNIGSCPIIQDTFYLTDRNNDKIITEEELNNKPQYYGYSQTIEELKKREEYKIEGAKEKIKQCDTNADKKLNHKEAVALQCQIPKEIFSTIDSNQDTFISFNEIKNIPTKYATLRNPYYTQNEDDKIETIISPVVALAPMAIMECDTNDDKKLSEKEATNLSCGFTQQDFIRRDLNKDGVFSKKDMAYYYHKEIFNKLDINKDNGLDFNEIIELY